MKLDDLKMSTKVGLVMAVLIVANILGIGASLYVVQQVNHTSHEMKVAADEMSIGATLSDQVLEIDRNEYILAAKPERAKETVEKIHAHESKFKASLKEAMSHAGLQQKDMLEKIRHSYEAYEAELAKTISLAERVAGAVEINAAGQAIVRSVESSQPTVEALHHEIGAFVKYTNEMIVQAEASILDAEKQGLMIMGGVAIVGIIFALALGIYIARYSVSIPLKKLVESLNSLANGDMSTVVSGAGRKDEVGDIARSVDAFREFLLTKQAEESAADEVRRTESEEAKKVTMNALADELELSVDDIVNSLSGSAEQMETSAQTLSQLADETNGQATSVSAASDQVTANVETVASAAEELSASIAEINERIARTSVLSNDSAEEARATNESVGSLRDAAERIGDVVNLIQDIAEQTNLLALNATIEAARAGEAGKGFAVVASEVKSLANQTGKATQEIASQIASMQDATTGAVAAIERISIKIQEINETVASVASAAEEQSAATNEIARNVQEAAGGTKDVSHKIGTVVTAAGSTGQTAGEVLNVAGILNGQSGNLREKVHEFITQLRAA